MYNGYVGKLLRINLCNRSIEEEELPIEHVKKYIGGSGLGAKYLFDMTDRNTDPLGAENVLIYMTGPFLGSPVPASGRHQIIAKSPLTEIWGEADVGGDWGAWLKSVGYDGIIIQGASEVPVYIYISNEAVEIRNAENLWGKDTYEIQEELENNLGHKIAISCIGVAGENIVKFSSIMHDGKHGRAGGRCGLGAVMGAKKLKGVVLKRGNKKTAIYDKAKLMEDLRRIVPIMRESRKESSLYGTSRSIPSAEAVGDLPIKNWTYGKWNEEALRIGGRRMSETILVGKYACNACPVACGRVVKVSDGPFSPVDGAGYEYETGGLLGASCLVDNMEAIAKANELCNKYGMDTISTGSVIAFAMEAFECGALDESRTGGLVIKWGDANTLIKLIELIAKRRGIGKILAEGSKKAADIIGGGSNRYSIHVKNLDLPAHDPRYCHGMGLGYATSNKGACHTDSFSYVYESKAKDRSLNIGQPIDKKSSEGKAYLVATLQNFMALCDSLKICKFLVFGIQASDLHRWLKLITGWDMTFDEFIKTGERIFNLKRLYNVRCGIRRKDDNLPERILTLHREGLKESEKLPDLDKMLDEYYKIRGWDEDGIPRKEKLAELNLPSDYSF